MRALPMLATLAILVAGCVDDNATPPADRGSFGGASGLAPDRSGASLDAAPQLAVGEWWRYRVTATFYGQSAEFTAVVAGATADHYLVGIAGDEPAGLPYIMHFPGLGEVARADLAWDAHDAPFKLLDFPLEAGRSWNGTYWGGQDMAVEVAAVEGPEARLRLRTAGGVTGTYTFDASAAAITAIETTLPNGMANWGAELLDHGFGHNGTVRIPIGADLLMCHGRAAVATTVEMCAGGSPDQPSGAVEIPNGYTTATFALVINPGTVGQQLAPSTMSISVEDPHGGRHELQSLPGQGPRMSVGRLDEPGGSWQYEVVAGGPGYAILEGVVYREVSVDLPSGCVRSAVPDGLAATPCVS